MINEKDFLRIKKELVLFDKEREELIKKSREILKQSKQAIYLVHRNEFKVAEKLLEKIEKEIKNIKKTIKCNPKLDFLGAYSVANQEYVEAKCYYGFVKNNKIPTCSDLNVQVEDYLLGLCDLTGELGRRAVASVIKKEFDNVYKIQDVVDQIYGLFLQLDLRNGELRKKSDGIKWNLKKIEGIIYDIKIKNMDN
jgi:translin